MVQRFRRIIWTNIHRRIEIERFLIPDKKSDTSHPKSKRLSETKGVRLSRELTSLTGRYLDPSLGDSTRSWLFMTRAGLVKYSLVGSGSFFSFSSSTFFSSSFLSSSMREVEEEAVEVAPALFCSFS